MKRSTCLLHCSFLCVAMWMAGWTTSLAFAQQGDRYRDVLGSNDLITEPPQSLYPRLSRVAKLFVDQCVGCHNREQADGGYVMDSPQALLMPGQSKKLPVHLDPKDVHAHGWGELVQRLTSDDVTMRMPKDAAPLDQESIDAVIEWIAFGAKVDGAMDAPLEMFVPTKLDTTPTWVDYPKPHPVQAIRLAPEMRTVFTSGAREVLVWSLEGAMLGRVPVRGRFVADIEWNPHAMSLVISSGDPGQIGYVESVPWSVETNMAMELARVVHWVSRDVPLDIALSPDGQKLAIGNPDGTLVVTSSSDNTVLWKSAAHAAAITSVDWSDDGLQVLSSSRDRMAKAHASAQGDLITSFVDHERVVASVCRIDLGAVTMDEAGSLRIYPGGTASNPRASRGGFSQRTPKIDGLGDTVYVPDEGGIRRFRFRTEEVVESKDDQGKEKKKTHWIIDELGRIPVVEENSSGMPLSMNVEHDEPRMMAVGLADGSIWVWEDIEQPPKHFVNQVGNRPVP